ncbi:MAG: c-type cytochrome [Ilumatobacteraceae bacterium]
MNDRDRSPRTPDTKMSTPGGDVAGRVRRGGLRWMPALLVGLIAAATPLLAQAGPTDDELRTGADAYRSACSTCHQPGGVGLPGQYPPLIDNPHVEDTEYLRSVIVDGLDGEIVVNGESYDGLMPAQSTLSDDHIEAIITYVQSGFAAPTAPVQQIETGSDDEGVNISLAIIATLAVLYVIVAIVFWRRLVGAHDRRTLPWFDAALKTVAIVVGLILLTTVIPAKVLEIGTVQDLSREAQDLLVLGLWTLGLGGGLTVLWWAHRENRI